MRSHAIHRTIVRIRRNDHGDFKADPAHDGDCRQGHFPPVAGSRLNRYSLVGIGRRGVRILLVRRYVSFTLSFMIFQIQIAFDIAPLSIFNKWHKAFSIRILQPSVRHRHRQEAQYKRFREPGVDRPRVPDADKPWRPSRAQVRTKARPVKLLRWSGSGSGLQALHHRLLLCSAFKIFCSSLLLAYQTLTLFVLRLDRRRRCNISSHNRHASQHSGTKN